METDVKIEELGKCRVRLSITVPENEVSKTIEDVFLRIKPMAKVPGFRPGKAPREMVESMYQKVIREESIDRLIKDAYLETLKSRNLHPFTEAVFEDIKFEKGSYFSFCAMVEVSPEITLPDYINITLEPVEVQEPTEEEVGKVVEMHRNYHAKYEPVEGRAVEHDDYIVINLTQTVDEKSRSEQNQMLKVDAEKLLPGFADNVVGMVPGDKKSFELNITADFHAKDLAGKQVKFDVELSEIKRRVLPPLDDEFAKDTGRAETLDGLKEDIRKILYQSNEKEARESEEQKLLDTITGMTQFELPFSLLNDQIRRNMARMLQRDMYSGASKEELEGRREAIFEKAKESAEKQLKLFFILHRIAGEENIEVDDSEVDAEIARIAESQESKPEELKKKLEREDRMGYLRDQLLADKVVKFLYENAKKNIART